MKLSAVRSLTVYISGPMSGLPAFNYPAFHAAAAKLRAAGHTVLSPAENFDGRQDLERKVYMRRDIEMVLQADAIAMLPGWENSRGAKLEHAIAYELGLLMFTVSAFDPHIGEEP